MKITIVSFSSVECKGFEDTKKKIYIYIYKIFWGEITF